MCDLVSCQFGYMCDLVSCQFGYMGDHVSCHRFGYICDLGHVRDLDTRVTFVSFQNDSKADMNKHSMDSNIVQLVQVSGVIIHHYFLYMLGSYFHRLQSKTSVFWSFSSIPWLHLAQSVSFHLLFGISYAGRTEHCKLMKIGYVNQSLKGICFN